DAVEAAGGDDGEERRGTFRVDITPIKHPVFPPDHDLAQCSLGAGIVEWQSWIVSKRFTTSVLSPRKRSARRPSQGGDGDEAERLVQLVRGELGACRFPVLGRELKVAVCWPV